MADSSDTASAPVSRQRMRLVIGASAAGTIFEWYDFFVYGLLTAIMARHFFAGLPDTQAYLFSLLTFSVGMLVRPLGALVFGKMGDARGRKGAFLITITTMGVATVAIGLLPTAAQIGIWAPSLLIVCRILQGFALGGEYGGAAIYVSEHAERGKRGSATAAIQASAAMGLLGALGVIFITREALGEEQFAEWGWRIPFLASALLLAISLYIRLKLEESPAFHKLKEEGRISKRAYAESFLEWRNLKYVLLALFGLMMAQGVGWYTSFFYTQVFIEKILRVNQEIINQVLIIVVMVSAPLYMVFAWLSDKVGRRPVILFGLIVLCAAYFPGFHLIAQAANPALERATLSSPVTVRANPETCNFMLDLTGGAQQFASSCDIARGALADAGVSYDLIEDASAESAVIEVGGRSATAPDARGLSASEVRAARAEFAKALGPTLEAAGYPPQADTSAINMPLLFGALMIFVIGATALYGPQAAALVELFPTRIRYTAFSLPYNIGTGVFGAISPLTSYAIVTATGDIYAGLWFPLIITAIAAAIFFFAWPETKDRDIHA